MLAEPWGSGEPRLKTTVPRHMYLDYFQNKMRQNTRAHTLPLCILFNVDQTNFTVTRNQEIAWCTKNQQAWLSSKGLGFPQTSSSIDTSSSHVCGVALEMSSDTAVFPSISDAIRWLACGKDTLIEKARDGSPEIPPKLAMAEHVQILVTGSLHLVGGVIKFLGPGTVELV